MKTVLITGIAGFIPSNLGKSLLRKGYRVVGVDNLLTGNLRNIASFKDDPNFSFVQDDVNNLGKIGKIFHDSPPNYVYHYAACVGVKRTLNNPMWVLNDIDGIKNILELSRNFDVKRVFFSSSSEVYGEPVELPQVEDSTPLNSKLPYAVVKNVGEVFAKSYQQTYGLDYTIFRFFNTYGPGQSDDFVMTRFIAQALENKPLTIYGDGSQTRTFCYIDDNIAATTNAISDESSINDTINVGSETETTILELAETIIRATNSKSTIEHLPALKEGDMTRRQPSNQKMLQLLNGRKLMPFEVGLQKTIEYVSGISR